MGLKVMGKYGVYRVMHRASLNKIVSFSTTNMMEECGWPKET